MIVQCAYCGPLPSDDLERWGERAWAKHVHEKHPEWPPGVAYPAWDPAQRDGEAATDSGVARAGPEGAVEAERRQDQAEPCNSAPPTNALNDGRDGA